MTAYIGALEEVATTGATTTTTAYYGGLATSVNGALSYTPADGLGSVSEAVNATTGAVTATQLYAPYGAVRYQSGSLPGSRGFTGQHSDAATSGLDYYGARYYDPAAGQFTSADTTLAGGLNRYAYVGGNPATRTDPTGHFYTDTTPGGAPRLDPVPNRPNYYNEFLEHYWQDQHAGEGFYDDSYWRMTEGSQPRSEQQKKSDAIELADGNVLAAYFGLTVRRKTIEQGPTGPLRTADYAVEIQPSISISELGPLVVADRASPEYSTSVELYTPHKGTDWLRLPGGRPAGIIGEGYEKGGQASIVAIDISELGEHSSKSELEAYAAQIVYWSPTPRAQAPSRVVRVIFIDNGEVVADYNPTNFGPPAPGDRPENLELS